MSYQIWAFTPGGEKVAYLENAFSIKRAKKMNQTPTLSLSLPSSDPKTVYLTSAYEVKVYNTIKARWEDLYILDDCTEKWSDSGSVIECNYSGVMAQLVKEDNITYDTTVTPKTPTQIISAILAMQERTPAITVGTIQPTTAFSFSVENAGMLESLFECTDYLGGYIEVDSNRALNWYNTPAGSPVREIRYQKNMKSVSRKSDFSQIVNRLYAYGAENPDVSRLLNLTDAGESHEYIEDSASQTAYGISRKRKTDGRITHPSTLLRWANQLLLKYKNPIYYYTVDAVNLAEHPDFDFDFESLEIGQMIRVINSDLNNLSVDVSVVGVDTDLSAPENITIELSTNVPDISDSFQDVKSAQNLSQNVAVQIGAGQVTVQGAFTVEGWRSAGQTTINGGQITANTITVNQLNFTPITGTNIVASINASSEGIQISGDKISITGLTHFASGYDPSTKIATGLAAADINTNTTTIDGGKITAHTISAYQIAANTITVSELNFVPVTGTNVIASINASSEGIKVTASKITLAGIVALTDDIKTTDFVSGSAGWRIKGDGTAEFNNVTVRGTVYAASGEFSGTLKTTNLYSSSTLSVHGTMQSDSYVADTSGWKIQGSGTVEFNSVKLRGNLESTNWTTNAGSQINMTNGTFKMGGSSAPKLYWNGSTLTVEGTIKATSGEFTGTLKTSNIDASHTLTVNGTMQSTTFTAGSAGWQIKGDGSAEFNNVTVRGAVYASSGEFSGSLKAATIAGSQSIIISSTGVVKSSNFSSGSAGFQIKGDGSAEFSNVVVRGELHSTAAQLVMSGFTQGAGYMPNNSLATDGTNLYFKNNGGSVWQLN